jgi:hypothetical protein
MISIAGLSKGVLTLALRGQTLAQQKPGAKLRRGGS